MFSLAPTRTGMPYPMPAPSCPPEHANMDGLVTRAMGLGLFFFFSSLSVLLLQQTADGLGVQHRERGGGQAPADWAAPELLSKRNGSRTAAARCCLSTADNSRLTIRIHGRALATARRGARSAPKWCCVSHSTLPCGQRERARVQSGQGVGHGVPCRSLPPRLRLRVHDSLPLSLARFL